METENYSVHARRIYIPLNCLTYTEIRESYLTSNFQVLIVQ